jgi:hypothetical protein
MVFSTEKKMAAVLKHYRERIAAIESGRACKTNRWYAGNCHGWLIKKRFLAAVKGLRMVTVVTLTFAPEIIKKLMPAGSPLCVAEFLLLSSSLFLQEFLGKLSSELRRGGRKWRLIGWTQEFQGNGNVHFNLLFYGGWVADLKSMCAKWPYSEAQGVDVASMAGAAAVEYVCKYISKFELLEKKVKDAELCERLKALMLYFNLRQFYLRSGRKQVGQRGNTRELMEDRAAWSQLMQRMSNG